MKAAQNLRQLKSKSTEDIFFVQHNFNEWTPTKIFSKQNPLLDESVILKKQLGLYGIRKFSADNSQDFVAQIQPIEFNQKQKEGKSNVQSQQEDQIKETSTSSLQPRRRQYQKKDYNRYEHLSPIYINEKQERQQKYAYQRDIAYKRCNSNPRKQELTELKDYPKIFIIYTGGTVGQKFYENRGYCCCPGYLIQCLKEDKNFLDRELDHVLKEQGKIQKNQHITGVLEQGGRIIYEFIEYDPILDSSDIYEKDWKKMAADIEKRYEEFQGFVIIHGTDTMAFTASALSFMFENLTKPVVLTGSQIPIAECWNDAKLNLLGSMMVAANYQIPEVLIFFGNKLLRGNRSIKIDNLSFTAFDSPNMPILGEFGAEKKIYWEHILKPVSSGQFRVQYDLETNITPLLMYPLITGQQIAQLTAPPCKGLIIRAYGMGNFPARKEDVLGALKQAIDRGVLIVLGSQCLKGKVKQVYENTLKLFKMGVCTSNDMTFESQLCKLAYCFKKYSDIQDVKKYMQKSLRGEMSDSNFIFQDELEEGLQSNLKGDFLQKQIIFSIQQGYVSFLKEIIAKEPHIEFADIRDYKGRPILHLAVMNGTLEITQLLINKGCYVDKLDSYGKSAFYEAIRKGRFEIAEFLESKGGTLIANSEDMSKLRNVTKISINARVLWNKYVACKKYKNL